MSAQVVCPHCNKTIKLRDRSLLGKKGKCPGCAKSFMLQEQAAAEEVIPLQLVDEEPAVGTGAKWVPDDPVLPVAGEVPVAYIPIQTPQGVVLAPVMSGQLPGYPTVPPSQATANSTPAFPDFNFDIGEESPTSTATSSSAPPSSTKRPARKSRNNNSTWVGVGVAVLALIAGGLYLNSTTVPSPMNKPVTAETATTGTEVATLTTPPGAYSREALTLDSTKVAEFRPTQGEPILLNMLTGTNNVLIHMRPDQIWGTEQHASKELKASLTQDVVNWLEASIKKITRRNPDQIEEILIGISVLSKVEPPQISTVFRLKKPEKLSALIDEFKGEEISMQGKPVVTKNGEYAYHIKDPRTIAISPALMGGDLSDSVKKPLECVTDGIQELLKASDRDRSFTVFMDVTDATTYSTQLFEPSVEPTLVKLLDWFGPEAETVSWSLHVGKTLHSEIRVRPKGSRSGTGKVSTAETLKVDYETRWPKTIEQELVGAVKQMRPTQSGFRQIIGRFPAMVEAFRQATIYQTGPKHLTMTTVLPAKAAPNLALATVLTWDESTRTNFGSSDAAMPIASSEDKLPKTVLGRLKSEFEIEFSNKPLADAFLFIGDEAKVTFVIDGDALKLVGYTKNQAQTFKLGKVTGTNGIYTIFTQPRQEKMCLVVDDAKMEALITTIPAAEAKGLKIVPVESLK